VQYISSINALMTSASGSKANMQAETPLLAGLACVPKGIAGIMPATI
jgi:hypothetical protein